eukprot:COSAG02_NODE_66281_length_256_cov_0.490446_1_plen_20_part_10
MADSLPFDGQGHDRTGADLG